MNGTSCRWTRLIGWSAFSVLLIAGCPTGTPTVGGGGFNLPPTPQISSSISRGVAPLEVAFSSSQSTDDGLIVRREWDFGDGTTSLEISPTHVFETTGSFTVSLTLTDDDGVTATRTTTINVTEAPFAIIGLDRNEADTAPATINFDGSGSFDPDGTIESYAWDFGDGARDTLEALPHTFDQAGTFRVRLTVTDNVGVSNTTEVLVRVGIPQPDLEIRIPPSEIDNLVLTNESKLWIQGVVDVTTGVPQTVRAGIDRDLDACNAKSVRFDLSTLTATTEYTGHDEPVTDMVIAADGSLVASSSLDGTVIVFNAINGIANGTYFSAEPATCVALSSTATFVAYGLENGTAIVRNVATGAIVATLAGGHVESISDISFSADDSLVVTVGEDNSAIVWNLLDGTVLVNIPHPGDVNTVAYSPIDPDLFFTGDAIGDIRLLSPIGAQFAILQGHDEAVNALAVSVDSSLLVSGGADDRVVIWNLSTRTIERTIETGFGDVTAVGISVNTSQIVVGFADAAVRVYSRATGNLVRTFQPCTSAVSAVAIDPFGSDALVAVQAASEVQLDVESPNGNDLNISVPSGLLLKNVPSLRGADVAPDEYFLWAEIDTDQTIPTRVYSGAAVNVIDEFTQTIAAVPPVVPLLNNEALILQDPSMSPRRQVYDLGPFAPGDRIFLSRVSAPGFRETFTTDRQFSTMLVDDQGEIFAWFQGPNFILLTPDTRLVVPRATNNMYVIADGNQNIRVRVDRTTNLLQTRGQRVSVRFDGGTDVFVANTVTATVPDLDAADFNQTFVDAGKPNPAWGATETQEIKDAVMAALNSIYAPYDVTFVSSDDGVPAPPFQTLYIGGFDPFLFGIADYIDARNDTATGTAIVFVDSIALPGINDLLTNPINTPTELGTAIGRVGAHEVGHLLGLRHTDDPTDLMASGTITDLTDNLTLKASLVSQSEQLFPQLPVQGTQNAPQLLLDTLGPR